MKKIQFLAIFVLANIPLVSSAVPRSEIYLVDVMHCKGILTTNNPGMRDEYKKLDMDFRSMKSTRRDGTLANALVVEASLSSDFYTSPLYVKKNRIRKKLGIFNALVELKIVSMKTENGTRTDILKGNFSQEGTVVGDTNYALQCDANVVKEVSRIDDMTTGKWLKVLAKNRALSKKIEAADKNSEIYDIFREYGESYKVRDLKGDAKRVYDKADPEFKSVETIKVDPLGVTLIHVSDAPEGNGCEYLFNLEGEYLNRICGTESGEWEWEEK